MLLWGRAKAKRSLGGADGRLPVVRVPTSTPGGLVLKRFLPALARCTTRDPRRAPGPQAGESGRRAFGCGSWLGSRASSHSTSKAVYVAFTQMRWYWIRSCSPTWPVNGWPTFVMYNTD